MSNELTIKQQLAGDAFKEQVAKALPEHLTPERFVRVALTALNRTPKLLNCTQQSLFKCLLDCSSLGIEPDGRRAYLIPYGKECTLIISYIGLIELCKRNGNVSSVYGTLVHANDQFELIEGLNRDIVHKRALEDRGGIVGCYAVVKFKDQDYDFDYMDMKEIEAIRKRSKSGMSGPWISDWGEMAKKTVIRRLLKRQTLSPEIREKVEMLNDVEPTTFAEKVDAAKPAEQVNPFLPSADELEEANEEFEEAKKADESIQGSDSKES